ncbi:hypothetical protein [Rossellomorea marisflavi]|uniref:hypothetical protein n=1 Tax=Rossellomorea marisflavi TaxID=189381 RepID=UPI00345D1FDF
MLILISECGKKPKSIAKEKNWFNALGGNGMMQSITIIVPVIISLFLCIEATQALEEEKHMLVCLIIVLQSILITVAVNAITSL